MLTPETLPAVQAALADADVDGWLLYDFRGINPISQALLRAEGLASRRMFAWVPRRGTPVAITHAIEPGSWAHWPAAWDRRVYSSWKSLEAELSGLVRGKRAAMEYSPGDAVPVVDRVPAGVLEMVRAAGATVVTSADLVTRFFAVWTQAQLASHRRAAEIIARIAKEAFARAGASVRAGAPLAEHELMLWIKREFTAGGLSTDHGPNVSATENAANPHYEPSAGRATPAPSGRLRADRPVGRRTRTGSTPTRPGWRRSARRRRRWSWSGTSCATRATRRSRCCASASPPAKVVRGAEADDAARGA